MYCPFCGSSNLIIYPKGDLLCGSCGESFFAGEVSHNPPEEIPEEQEFCETEDFS